MESPVDLQVNAGEQTHSGQLVLIGNGRLYGGSFELFPRADLQDGLLDVCVFPQVNFAGLLRCGTSLVWSKRVPEAAVLRLALKSFTLSSPVCAGFELEGEWVGELPVQFSVLPRALRVLAPS